MELPPSSKYLARQDEPVSDAERESLAARLAEEFEAGRMDQPTYLELVDITYDASTLGELAPVVRKVPADVGKTPDIVRQGAGSGKPGELAPIKQTMPPVAIAGAVAGVGLVLLIAILLIIL